MCQGSPGNCPPLALVERGYDELPAELTSLVGRDELVGQLLEEVRTEKLVSLTGPGGVGRRDWPFEWPMR